MRSHYQASASQEHNTLGFGLNGAQSFFLVTLFPILAYLISFPPWSSQAFLLLPCLPFPLPPLLIYPSYTLSSCTPRVCSPVSSWHPALTLKTLWTRRGPWGWRWPHWCASRRILGWTTEQKEMCPELV